MLTYAEPAAVGLDADQLARVYAYLESEAAAQHIPGAALLVARHDEPVAPRAFGSPHLAGGTPMRPENIFLVASVTKPLTVTAAMLLVERGQLCLDELVGDIIPEFASKGKETVRVRHLMSHTSGLPDMLPDNQALREQHQPLSEFVKRMYDLELSFPPGTNIQYQSCGLAILGEIVERRAGTRLPQFLRTEVFDPLGMHDTGLGAAGLDHARIAEVNVGPDMEGKDWNWNMPYWWNFGAPWGGMFTTVSDFYRLLQMFLNGGEFGGVRVLSPATTAVMTRDHTSDNPQIPAEVRYRQAWGLGWGLHWRRHPTAGWPYFGDLTAPGTFGHGGATGTVVWADPARELVCVIFTTEPSALNQGILGRCSNLVAASII
ncbi:MAG: serine hydrolase domain-containing protein [Litorilinea sp.]